MEPSLEAINAYADIPTDLHIFRGEEIHVLGRYIHAVNFGGNISVNEFFNNNESLCESQVKAIADGLKLPPELDAMDIARRCWIANKIREGGGMAIFVHPHWIDRNTNNIPDAVSNYIFEHGCYDAFELLGGITVFENNTQVAMYNEQRSMGRVIPIVGSSDSHGTEPAVHFCDTFSIVFAENATFECLKDSISKLYSTAVESYPGEQQRAHGTYRMAKYSQFLLREYFPLYEELCYEQGRAMKDAVTGTDDAIDVLRVIKGRTDKFYNAFFGK